jgi:hypothetical protein
MSNTITSLSYSLYCSYYSSSDDSLGTYSKSGSSFKTSYASSSNSVSDNDTSDYSSVDGDTVTLSSGDAGTIDNSDEKSQRQAIIDEIVSQYNDLQVQLKKILWGSINNSGNSSETYDPLSFDETQELPGLPDYWNADNTSQRIVDFATSFLSAFSGSGEEFFNTIKNAITEGFRQAGFNISSTPTDSVDKLTAKTYALTMNKLDEWAEEQGISTGSTEA